MARIRNLTYYSDDKARLQALYDELVDLGRGRWAVLDLANGRLTQLVYPPHKPKRKHNDKDEKAPRNKRAESAARHG